MTRKGRGIKEYSGWCRSHDPYFLVIPTFVKISSCLLFSFFHLFVFFLCALPCVQSRYNFCQFIVESCASPFTTGNMRQLVVDRRICCCSQFMIFLFELLGPAKQPMACPSSSNRKIMNWEQQQILLSTHNCPLYLWVNKTFCSQKSDRNFQITAQIK